MGMMDSTQDNMGGMDDALRARLAELQSKEQDGTLDDTGRNELQQIRDRMNIRGNE